MDKIPFSVDIISSNKWKLYNCHISPYWEALTGWVNYHEKIGPNISVKLRKLTTANNELVELWNSSTPKDNLIEKLSIYMSSM